MALRRARGQAESALISDPAAWAACEGDDDMFVLVIHDVALDLPVVTGDEVHREPLAETRTA
jgi:hypothetical protein